MGVLNKELETLRAVVALPPSSIQVNLPPPQAHLVRTSVRESDKLYVLAVNTGPTRLDAVPMSISAPGNFTLRVLFENRTLQATNSRWQDTFAPYARHVYELTPAP
jgi:hypothetical protein